MNTEKIVFSKLFKDKTNLSKTKVRLSLADDIANVRSQVESVISESEDYEKKLRDLGKRINKIAEESSTLVSMSSAFLGIGYLATEKVDEVIENVRAKSEELGIDPSVINGFTELEEISKIDFFKVKYIEDAYFEEVHYNADRLLQLVNAQW